MQDAVNLKKKILWKQILAWCFYDWAYSAFFTLVITFIFATYFTQSIAPNSLIGTKWWGNMLALSGVCIAVLSPILGSIADKTGRCKPWMFVLTLLAAICISLLWFSPPHMTYPFQMLALIFIANTALEISTVFYNSLIPHLVPANYIGRISGWGWGFGYLGGLSALLIALLGFVLHPPTFLNIEQAEPIRLIAIFISLWLLVFSIPLFLFVPDYEKQEISIPQAIIVGLKEFYQTVLSIRHYKIIGQFLIARMIYNDGLATLFAFGGIFAASIYHFSVTQIMMLGIVLNVFAGIGAIGFAWFDDEIGAKPTILFSLTCLTIFGMALVFINNVVLFWILASILAIFVGPTQAASRSLMSRLSPAEKRKEMFGLFALSGKATAFIGPWLFGLATYYLGTQRAGMFIVMLFFIIGGFGLLCTRLPEMKIDKM